MNFKDECQKLFDHYVAYYRAGDAVGCASVYSLNAELYSPYGPPAIGRSYCQIWCLRVLGYAAIWLGLVVSIPSLNVTPVMTLAR